MINFAVELIELRRQLFDLHPEFLVGFFSNTSSLLRDRIEGIHLNKPTATKMNPHVYPIPVLKILHILFYRQ